jgi:transketolase
MGLEPLSAKFSAFGWHVIDVDGHDLDAILGALEEAFEQAGKPSVIIANTVKGKGVPFMENVPQWHGSVKLSRQQAEDALKSLGCGAQDLARWLDVRH